ncbi:alpha-glucosidase C-terminal domain-containing protein [Undibacterium sp. Jales W-56]|uniref:alpha-amylase family glycosyl hydrolase n=1 Tax=Undibacterium sp. Jales W-56 TaxID=2897325 RepID=UPI0021CFB559|nr:alpha-amylase family glycosyl hydrolase [Undibacterium sp. Jales W-56]MCU6434512.1 alpha-glucosidase C-terminal domain-containing protein [Undibacterium sp. Jales W-56]
MKKLFIQLALSAAALLPFAASAQVQSSVKHLEWTKNATIYEANIRQHSKEGSFQKFEEYLPELKKMGVTVIWLMPINPIGEKNRKGTLGSYYAVKDYKGVNPEFGTPADFKHLVNAIHAAGMYVIIDWVPNHTAWDHPWATEHPDFYKKDKDGHFMPPVPDWMDVIALNYENKQLRAEMIDAMRFWLTEYKLDGFRCDVAAMVPVDFWNEARVALDQTKPVFMLAEASEYQLQEKAFDMTYGWQFKDLFNDIAQGKKSAKDLDAYLNGEEKNYHLNSYRMLHITNHDLNSWEGTEFERLGDATESFLVLSNVIKGMPLLYSGQEAGNTKRLDFFERDPIQWKDHPFKQLYTKLFHLKKSNKALWNGLAGGQLVKIKTGNDDNVFAFTRQKDRNKIVAIFNLSNKEQVATVSGALQENGLVDIISGEKIKPANAQKFTLKPWEYKVFAK